MTLRAEACEQSLGAAEVLGGGEPINERGGALTRRCNPGAHRGARRAPTTDGYAEREHGGDARTPAQQGPDHQDLMPPRRARRRDAGPQLLARRCRGAAIVLRRLPQPLVEPIVAHDTHSPAKSASASRSLARARDSCAFDVPVSMPRVAPISSCVYPSTSCIKNTVR